MNNKKRNELKNSIRICNLKINTIRKHLNDDKPMLNESYNRLLIEKAALCAELNTKKKSVLSELMRKICKPQKQLICDYFK